MNLLWQVIECEKKVGPFESKFSFDPILRGYVTVNVFLVLKQCQNVVTVIGSEIRLKTTIILLFTFRLTVQCRPSSP